MMALIGVWSGVTTLHRYSDREPYWIVMVGHQLNGWGAAAYYAAEVLTEFAGTVKEVRRGVAAPRSRSAF
jgi:hypothetical protein